MTTTHKPNLIYWIIAVIAIIWNAMGVNQYLQQQYNTEAFKSQYTPEQLELVYNMPSWAIAAFAIAVFAGLLGALALLLRKKVASLLFSISLIAVLIQMIYNFVIINSLETYGPGGVIMPIMILLIAIFLVVYSKNAVTKGWLK